MMSPCFSSLWRTIQAFCSLKRSMTFSGSYWSGKPTLNLLGGSERTLGKRKRTVPKSMPIMEAVKATQAIPNQLPNISAKKERRVLPALAGALGGDGGFGCAGGRG